MIRRTVALFAMLMLAGCESPLFKTPPPPTGERLNEAQITAVLAGNSLVRSADEVPLTVYFAENGALHGVRSNHYKDSGTWKVEQDAVCGQWRNWFGTMSQCWAVYQSDKMLTFKRTDHGDTFRAAIESGNVASLR